MTRPLLGAALAGLLAAASAGPAAAQSVYGLNFIGEHMQRGSARHAALGYSAAAVPDTNNVITQNASTTADMRMVSFSLTQTLSMARISQQEEYARQTRYRLPAVMMALPLRSGLVLSGGYQTRFSGRSDFAFRREVEEAPAALEQYRLDSSLFSIPVALAWKPFPVLNVSAEVQFERGSITDRVKVSFDDQAYRAVESQRRRSFSGTSWGTSFLLRVHSRLWIAGTYDAPVDYTVEETITHTKSAFDSSAAFGFALPAAWSAGLAVNVRERWWLTSSYWTRPAPEAAGFPHLGGALGNETHLGVGLERRMGTGGSLFERVPLRLGFSTGRWHLEFPPGTPVRSYFFTLGSALRLPAGPGCIDFTAEFGRIGSADENGFDEKMLRLSFGVSVAESWTRRRTVRH